MAGRLLVSCRSFSRSIWVFFGANLLKIQHGGWFPLAIATADLHRHDATWHRKAGLAVATREQARTRPLDVVLRKTMERPSVHRPEGTAVYLTRLCRRIRPTA